MRHYTTFRRIKNIWFIVVSLLLAACVGIPPLAELPITPSAEMSAAETASPEATAENLEESPAPITEEIENTESDIEQAATEEISSEDEEDASEAHLTPNRLIDEKSPYLLQHAYNPVDWYAWGPEAFERARAENKPIFLSIGYSTCHWCHVMEAESFEDETVGALMNETFIAIKVDREERPDIDNIYMNVAMMMNGSGGWPLNIIMTPDQKPFFAGTYLPKETRFERMGMLDLVPRVKEVWETQNADILKMADEVTAALQPPMLSVAPGDPLGTATLDTTFQQLSARFDTRYGGFGTSPKFPSPHNLLYLLRHWERTGDPSSLAMVEATLSAMRQGGVFDQVGFGFHRYSTDPAWTLPHFEKMLYDQAMLAMAYTEAYQATGNAAYEQTAREIFTYVLRDMTDASGGFYSAEDADSEGEEGKFYLWGIEELNRLLDAEDAALVVELFNLQAAGNFLEEASKEVTGTNIFHRTQSLSEFAAAQGIAEDALNARWEAIRQTLFEVREERIHPYKDDKILTDWNGLMIAALAKAAQVFDEPLYEAAATDSADFILNTLQNEDGRLLHRYRAGDAAILANVDDYAFLIWGLLDLYETTFELYYLERAITLNDELLELFWDDMGNGFYFTPDDGEVLLTRPKEIYDGAIPSGNSVAMLNLLRLGRITGNTTYEERAAQLSQAFASEVEQSPSAYTHLMSAINFGVGPSYEVVIVGEAGAGDTEAMISALRSQYVPNKIVLLRPPEEAPRLIEIADFTRYHYSLEDKATAYVCRNYYCEFPTTDAEEMVALLQKP